MSARFVFDWIVFVVECIVVRAFTFFILATNRILALFPADALEVMALIW
jgi:hypothetical protein